MKSTLGTKSIFLTVLIMLTGLPAVNSQSPEILHLCSPSAEKSVFLRSDSVHGGTCHWEARKFSEVSGDGSVVSERNYKAVNWCPAVVPGTVLTTLVNNALKLDFPGDISQVHFIRLWLRDENGKVVADAFYWRSRDKYSGAWTMTGPAVSGFQEMADLPRVQPGVRINHKIENERIIVNVGVDNPSGSIVFFNRLSLKDGHGALIAPIFFSDNFFSLLPGETKEIEISFAPEDYSGGPVILSVKGMNTEVQNFTVNQEKAA